MPCASRCKNRIKIVSNLIYHFAPRVFSTSKFPPGSFQQDEMVRTALGPIKFETAFYNEKSWK